VIEGSRAKAPLVGADQERLCRLCRRGPKAPLVGADQERLCRLCRRGRL